VVDVEPVRLDEGGRVAVADLGGHDDTVAGVDGLPGDPDVGQGNAAPAAVRDGQVAQQFLDRGRRSASGRRCPAAG